MNFSVTIVVKNLLYHGLENIVRLIIKAWKSIQYRLLAESLPDDNQITARKPVGPCEPLGRMSGITRAWPDSYYPMIQTCVGQSQTSIKKRLQALPPRELRESPREIGRGSDIVGGI